jgi:glycerophosphoryl diester phosphodiesterase
MIYGHRGARGLFPENTLEGIKAILKLPIDGIEIDVVVNGDSELIVSHNPFAHNHFSLDEKKHEVDTASNHNFFKMNSSKVKSYDVGTKRHPFFLKQEKFPAKIPFLSEVFEFLNRSVAVNFVLFLEIKSDQKTVGEYYPEAGEYALIVSKFLAKNRFKGQLIVKSFDPFFLNEFYRLTRDKYRLGYLVDNAYSLSVNLSKLDFVPSYYNPEFSLISENLVLEAHQHNIQIVGWTVNELSDYKRLMKMKIDGIITDYPNRFI